MKTVLGYFSFFRMASIGLAAVFVIGCDAGKNKTNVELITDMMDQPSMKSQDYDEVRKAGSNRLPPDGTVARGQEIYMYSGKPTEAESNLENPIAGVPDDEWLDRGAEKFRIYCGVCHGDQGKGDGPVSTKMALRPPSLLTPKVRAFKDGRIFHIITEGQGVMGPYASQINQTRDRWAIVNFIRHLQKSHGAE